uniref:Cation_ATPase_C domain-containing protein n=1 Tax=Heterorhabditis bacteriophora TaxID=37862 RepID=A0A1I7WZ85_HETBA
MRLQVQVGIECIVIACNEEETVDTKQYEEVRRTIGNSLVDPDDKVGDVLKDGDFIIIVIHHSETEEEKEKQRLADIETTKKTLIKLDKAKKKQKPLFRITFDFDPSPESFSIEKPTKLLVLDGNSLVPGDLVRCERGECIIQLSIEAEERIRKGRALLEKIAAEHKIRIFSSPNYCSIKLFKIWYYLFFTFRHGTHINVKFILITNYTIDLYEQLNIHRIRPHKGQNLSALRLRSLLHSDANPSQIAELIFMEQFIFLIYLGLNSGFMTIQVCAASLALRLSTSTQCKRVSYSAFCVFPLLPFTLIIGL